MLDTEQEFVTPHYYNDGLQPWEVMQVLLTPEEYIGFLKGNIIKYVSRSGKKDLSSDDMKKAAHYKKELERFLAEK